MKTTDYIACEDCAFYLATGDSSHMEWQEDFDGVQSKIDAALEAILRDEHTAGAFVHGTMKECPASGVTRCTFCDDDTMDCYLITVQDT